LRADAAHEIKGVLVVHNETATGVTSDVAAIRRAIDAAGHPALLYVDAVSSLASIPFEFDAWGVDLVITGSQKGLGLPAGLGVDGAEVVDLAFRRYNLSLGGGLGRVAGKLFRIGHMGDLNELMVLGALAGVEMAMRDAGITVALGAGVGAAAEAYASSLPGALRGASGSP